jgi:myosin heavy subunit
VLEEWSTASGVPEAAFQLQHLISAASLLTCKKDHIDDMEEIEQKCSLNDAQIHAILAFYPVHDNDSPLSTDILRTVAESAKLSSKTDKLLLSDYPIDFHIPKRVGILIVENYVPNYLSVPCIQAVMSLADV